MRSAGSLTALAILALAASLRVYGLSAWSLDGDELYSWFDVQRILGGGELPHGARSHPLVYLCMAICVKLAGQSELALRAFPALAGVVSVALLLCMRRDVLGCGQALAAGLVAAISPWLVFASQSARFYAPLLMFAAAATLAALPGERRRPLLSGLMLVLATLCHPSALLLAPALLLPLLGPPVRWRPLLRLAGVGALVTALLVLTDDGALAMVFRHVVDGADPSRYDLSHFVLGLGYNVGPLTGVLALVGLAAARRPGGPDRVLVAAALLPPLLLSLVAALGVSTHQRYATAAMPAVLLLAGAGVASLWSRHRALGLLSVVALVAASAPGLWAHLQDGNRHDLRAVAGLLAQRVGPDDIVVADEHAGLWLYLQRYDHMADVRLVEDTQVDSARGEAFLANKHEVWVALKLSRLDVFYDRAFMQWVEQFFCEVARVGRSPPPLVRHDNRYVLYRRNQRSLGQRPRRERGL